MLQYFSVGKILFGTKPRIDSSVFFMHYRVTFLAFVISSLLVQATQKYYGKPMLCTSAGVPNNVLNTYCYFTGTYTVPSLLNHTLATGVGHGKIPYPGVGQGLPNETVIKHTWYQWVSIVLFLQALFCYLPHFIWKNVECGLFKTIVNGLDHFDMDKENKAQKVKNLVHYVKQHMNFHRMWFIRFLACEAANLAVVLCNLYFIDYFLGGTFLTYGTDVINFANSDPETRVDPMAKIFPKMAKCTFRKFGPSGTLEVHDAFCLLSVNIINEKIYIVMWFWLIFMLFVSSVWTVFRLAVIVFKSIRNRMLSVRGKMAGANSLRVISERCELGDWFLIYQLGEHMESTVYRDFLKQLAIQYQETAPTLERKPMLMGN